MYDTESIDLSIFHIQSILRLPRTIYHVTSKRINRHNTPIHAHPLKYPIRKAFVNNNANKWLTGIDVTPIPFSLSLFLSLGPFETAIEIQRRVNDAPSTGIGEYDSTGIDDVSMGVHCGHPLPPPSLCNNRRDADLAW